MRKMKKIASLMMALVMVMAMSVTAFAATESAGTGTGSITITSAVDGESYTVYKMLDLTYDSTTNSYSYTTVSGWEGFFTSENGFTVSNGYVTAWNATTEITTEAELAKAALAYAKTNSTTITATASVTASVEQGDTEASASITGLDLGYYLVDTTLGTLCSLDSVNGEIEIAEKNDTAIVPEKKVKEDDETDSAYSDSNTAGIGETVNYQVTIKNAANKSAVVVIDTLSAGLTLVTDQDNNANVSVSVGSSEVPASNYTVTARENADGTTTLKIEFEDTYLATLGTDAIITIAYSAVVNENAVIGASGNGNSVTVSYGNDQSVTDTTTTKTYGFSLNKYTTVNDETITLEGAKFTLKLNDEAISFVGVYTTTGEGEEQTTTLTGYRVATAEDTDTTTTIVAGSVEITGLDAGTYTLTETEAPTGYNKLADSISVVISENGDISVNGVPSSDVDVENSVGSSLPSTGGIGTTIFYVVGTVLVLGAAVVLITRRRMSSEA